MGKMILPPHAGLLLGGASEIITLAIDDVYFATNTTSTADFSFTTDLVMAAGDHVAIIITSQNNSGDTAHANVTVDGTSAGTELFAEQTGGQTKACGFLYEIPGGGLTNPAIAFDTTNASERTTLTAHHISGTMTIGFKDFGFDSGGPGSVTLDVDDDSVVTGIYSHWGSTSNRTFTGLTNELHGTASNVQYGCGSKANVADDAAYAVSVDNNSNSNSLLLAISFI